MISPQLLAKVKRLQVLTKRSVSEVFAGEYSSAFRGRGMEFDEVRPYAPGDDVRTIDWNVTARTGEPYIKRFVEERELTVMLALDLSASGAFGSTVRTKNETAAELCALLAWVAAMNRDKAGLMIFTDRVERFVPPRKGRNHVQRIIREVLECEPEGQGTDLAGAMQHLSRVLTKRAVVFVISDFLSPAFETGHQTQGSQKHPDITALQLLSRKHDVVSLAISDPREELLTRAGLIELRDAETGERQSVDMSSPRVRDAFRARANHRRTQITSTMRSCNVDLAFVRTGDDEVHTLTELFRQREARR